MEAVNIKVYNAMQVLLLQQQEFVLTGSHTFSIDISALAKGSYFIEVDNGRQRGVAMFISQ
jgi:hypothetical protein